jgi:hypothetical protein
MQLPAPSFASFWAGKRLSAFEVSCLRSFVTRGYAVHLYSFDVIENVPEGVLLLDAAEIDPAESVKRFVYKGEATLSHYSDYFRYLLFQKTRHIWIDADMLLVRPIEVELGATVLAHERADTICGAVMRLDNANPALKDLIVRTEAVMDRDLHWGETGPRLLTKVFDDRDTLKGAFAPERFFPITHDDFWKVFLPEHREECETLCGRAWGVHLWNNIVDRLGIWKMLAPPRGSYLWQRFEQDDSLQYFTATYPEKVMRQMVENWVLRKNGQDLGIVNLSRQLVPSALRTTRHYLGDRALRFGSSPAKKQ